MTQPFWSKTIWLYARAWLTARVSGEVPTAVFGRPDIARTALCTLCGDNLTLHHVLLLQGTEYSCPRYLFMAVNFQCLLVWRLVEGKDYLLWTRSCFHAPVENNIAPWVKHLPTLVLWNLSRPSVSLGLEGKERGLLWGCHPWGSSTPQGQTN